MKQLLFIPVFLLFHVAPGQPVADQLTPLNEFRSLLEAPATRIQVFNFWATWCAPCVKELPMIDAFASANPDIEVILVNVEGTADPFNKVADFARRKKLQTRIILLNTQDSGNWTTRIEKSWKNALPVTIIRNGGNKKRIFRDRALSPGELEELVAGVR